MKEVMVHDRMNERTEECEFIVFDRMSRDYPERDLKKKDELERAYQLGLTFLIIFDKNQRMFLKACLKSSIKNDML